MTIQTELGSDSKPRFALLPWMVAAAALAVYLVTLNRWVSFGGLAQIARFSGWSWQPELHGPAYWLVTYPIRWLPVQKIPLALNVFSAVCAALCLALLARSVGLLPHDRTQPQRDKGLGEAGTLSIPAGWLPPVLAALVCGLQLTFWEKATAAADQFYTGGSSEMFDLLLFAYVIRCLLEFRVDERDSWLTRSAFVYGAAITNNWAMIGFFPLYVTALVWLKGLSFFNLRFLAQMTLISLAALSLYLLLPMVQSLSDDALLPFWPALKANLNDQRGIVLMLYKYLRHNLLLLSLTSLVPIFILSIRWASYFGDSSQLGVALATIMFHVVHALFLVACIWVALDPPVSPRSKGFGIPFLTFYYLGALSVGYFSGYFLLIFGRETDPHKRVPGYMRLLNSTVTVAIWLLLLLVPVALIYRNLPQIRITNGPMLGEYADLLAKGLPPRAVLLSDDPRRSLLLQSWAAQKGRLNNYVFVDAGAKDAAGRPGGLTFPEYHRYLKKRYPQEWPVAVPKGYTQPVDEEFLVRLVFRLAATNSVYYLQPSFGYYFEFFYLEPHGLLYRLKQYPSDTLVPPPLPKDVIAENNDFWAGPGERAIRPLLQVIAPPPPGAQTRLIQDLVERAHLPTEPNHTATVLGGLYSRALNCWGVELQKLGQLTNAAACFARAVELNPDNIVAEVNLECNKGLQAGREFTVQDSRSLEDQFGKLRSWEQVLSEDGPFDDPSFAFGQGRTFAHNRLQHQAAQYFERVKALAPRNLEARIWLAQLYVLNELPAKAKQLVDEIRAHPAIFPVPSSSRTEMLFVEASTHLANGDRKKAETAVETSLERYPDDEDLLETATKVYLKYQCYTNAVKTLESQIRLSPTNMTALVNMGNVCIWLGKYASAIPPLTRALGMDTNNPYALLNRAIAYLRTDNLDAAQRDYELLQKTMPTSTRVNYGLQEIAYRKKDTNAAIRYCQIYLANAQTNTTEAKTVSERLKELKAGPR
jgi:tetratricopeptide (TPR) repeat protein